MPKFFSSHVDVYTYSRMIFNLSVRFFIFILLLPCLSSRSFAESELELNNWGVGFKYTHNTYIFKKSESILPIANLSAKHSIELEMPSISRDLDGVMSPQATRVALMSVNKKIILERYANQSLRGSTPLAFSMSKSLTSLAIGHALCRGNIKSLDDKAAIYVPKLAGTSWGNSSIRQLLLMNSGSAVSTAEMGGWQNDQVKFLNGFIYRGSQSQNYIDDMIKNDEKKFMPGEVFQYNNYDTLALGLVIEGATNMEFVDFFNQTIWTKIGAENEGAWLRNRVGQAATYNGFSASPQDYLRLGHYINSIYADSAECVGNYMKDAVKTKQKGSTTRCYGYQIWTWCDEKNGFFFLGYGGQYLIMQPHRDIVLYLHQGSHTNDAKLISIYGKIVGYLYGNNFNFSGASIF